MDTITKSVLLIFHRDLIIMTHDCDENNIHVYFGDDGQKDNGYYKAEENYQAHVIMMFLSKLQQSTGRDLLAYDIHFVCLAALALAFLQKEENIWQGVELVTSFNLVLDFAER